MTGGAGAADFCKRFEFDSRSGFRSIRAATAFARHCNNLTDPAAMSNNLTKRDIVLDIYEKTGFPQKEVREVVQLTLDAIARALHEGRNVELRNFGVFEVQVRKSRIGRNPNRPETDVVIPARAVIKFKAGKEMKAELKKLDLEALQGAK
jgi:nucleoid DNA-binding protein